MWSCVQLLRVILALTLPGLLFFDISTELIPCQKYDILSLVVLGPIDLTKSLNESLGAKTSHFSRKFLDSINSACGKIGRTDVAKETKIEETQTFIYHHAGQIHHCFHPSPYVCSGSP